MNETKDTMSESERGGGTVSRATAPTASMAENEKRDLRNVRRALKLLQGAAKNVEEASRLVSNTLALDVRGATQALAEIGGRATAEAADALGIDLERMERNR